MRILILGANGAQGRALAQALAGRGALRGEPITRLGLADATPPERFSAAFPVVVAGFDMVDRAKLDEALAEGWEAIFQLAETDAARAEADFIAGLKGNFFGAFNLFESIRAAAKRPLVVFGSAPGAGETPPPTGYDLHKRIGELLLLDYTRRGFLDGRGVRLGSKPDPAALIAAAERPADAP